MRILQYFLLILAMIFLTSCVISKNPCSFGLNPDIACRMLDEKSDGTQLVEYFNRDTNEFRLILKSSSQEIEIEHPYGKVENFSNKVDLNQIKFERSNSDYLNVNGERFEIVKKE